MEWKEVIGFESIYSVSDEGHVLSHRRGRVLKPKTDKDGYLEYCLCVDNKRTYRRGHRLVATAFIPNPHNKPEVNHKNTVKSDNSVDNLEWATAAENSIHYVGGYQSDDKGLCNLTSSDWLEILDRHRAGMSSPDITSKYNLTLSRTDSIGEVLSARRLTTITGFTKDMRLPENKVSMVLKEDKLVMELLVDRLVLKLTNKECSTKYGISPAQVTRISKGTRRKDIFSRFEIEYKGQYDK